MFFGLPAYRKYEAKEIFVDYKTIGIEKVKNPALTFCPLNNRTGFGWTNTYPVVNGVVQPYWISNPNSTIHQQCSSPATVNEIYECIEDNTFKLTDFIRGYEMRDFKWDWNFSKGPNTSFWNRNDVVKMINFLKVFLAGA